ncbi:MAG: hypothetical protein JSS57_22165 [Proteobacteria bacterium]|nr:hypothetical protein [Pseudomonadota bacterium]
MNWLTTTILQYIAGGLLLLCIALGVRGCTAASARDAAIAERDAANTTVAAWQGKAEGCAAANATYDAVFEQQRQEQAVAEARAAEAARAAAAAVATATADAAKAKRERDDFAKRYAAKPAGCTAALQALDAACPLLKGY